MLRVSDLLWIFLTELREEFPELAAGLLVYAPPADGLQHFELQALDVLRIRRQDPTSAEENIVFEIIKYCKLSIS